MKHARNTMTQTQTSLGKQARACGVVRATVASGNVRLCQAVTAAGPARVAYTSRAMLTRSWILGLLALGLLRLRPSLARHRRDRRGRGRPLPGPLEGAPYRGAPHAKVTIVEFADFQCAFCGRVNETLAELLRRYPTQLKIVYRHMPLPFHKQAMLAAEASVSASAQGKFWVMFDRLFANPRALDRASLVEHARALGLDMPRFLEDLKTGRYRSYVLEDLAMAQRLGVNGTPMFFINGRPLSGAQPLVEFTTVIDEELARADKLLAKGVPLARVYAETTKNGLREASAGDEGDEEAVDEPRVRAAIPTPSCPYRWAARPSSAARTRR